MPLTFANATTNRVTAPSGVGDSLTAFSMLVWIRFTGQSANDYIMERGDGGQKALWGNPAIRFDVARATTNAVSLSSSTYTLSEWYCLIGTYDETDGPRIFKGSRSTRLAEDSYAVRTVGAGATTDNNANLWAVGNADGFSFAMDGNIAYAQLWDRRLTLPDLVRFYERPWDPVPGGPVFAWRLGEQGAGIQQDHSGRANHGTVTGAVYGVDEPDWFPSKTPWRRRRLWDVPQAAVGGTLVKDVIGIGFIPWAR